MTPYAVFGDGFVSRLETYTEGKLDVKGKCLFFGVPGMSTRRRFHQMFEQLLACKPRYVFINLGAEDIDAQCNPHNIYEDILHVVEELYRSGVQRVLVASIVQRGKFPSWTGMTETAFNKIRSSVNRKLKLRLGRDFIQVGKRLRYPRHYDRDLVHPGGEEGGLKVMKYAVLNAFRKVSN